MRGMSLLLLVGVLGMARAVPAAIVKGDANCDGRIGAADITAIIAAMGESDPECAKVDVDADAQVTPADVALEIGIVFPPLEEFVAQGSDFGCLLNLPQVRHFVLDNKLGHLDEALSVAEGTSPLPYPPGTIVQLQPFEAMVKRGGNFDLDNDNWEYFFLQPNGKDTTVVTRGRDEVVNVFGGNCFGCHSAARDYDFICEETHGCVQLSLDQNTIEKLKQLDPRCAH